MPWQLFLLPLNRKKMLPCQILYHKEKCQNLKFPSSCSHKAFIHSSLKKENSAIQCSLKPKIFTVFPEIHLSPQESPYPRRGSPLCAGRAMAARLQRLRPAPSSALCEAADIGISGRNASTGRGTQGAELAIGCWKERTTDVCPDCWKTWLAISFHLRDVRKGKGERERGSTHARTRIRLILPPH